MTEIHLFLASSITEFSQERYEFGDYIRMLDELYEKRGVRLRLHKCEDMSEALSSAGKQTEYDRAIRISHYFYLIVGKTIGEYSLHEFDVALESFLKDGGRLPYIMTFFKKQVDIDQSVIDLKERLGKSLQHYYSEFDALDSVKLKILLELSRHTDTQLDLVLKDDKLTAGNLPVTGINLDKVPMYAKNEGLQELRKRARELTARLAELRLKVRENPDDDDVFAELMRVRDEQKAAAEELNTKETDLLKAASQVVALTAAGEPLTERARTAAALLEAGEYEKAKLILDDEERRRETAQAEKKAQIVKNDLLALRKEILMKIEALRAGSVGKDTADVIIGYYGEAMEMSRKNGLDRKWAYEYVGFLYDRKRYAQAVKEGEGLYYHFRSGDEEADKEYKSKLWNLLASLYHNLGRYDEAEKLYTEALDIYRRLAASSPDAYEPDIAMTCNNLAVLCNDLGRYDEAEKLHKEALTIRRRLAASSPDAYEPDVATTCSNLANLYSDLGRYRESETLYTEALNIRRRLAASSSDAYEPDVAMTCSNLAILYHDLGRDDEAIQLYMEALGILRRLAASSPDAYEPDVATTCNNLAILYNDLGRFDEAEALYTEVLDTYRRLAVSSPDAYEPDVARTCNNLASLYGEFGRYDEGEALFTEALNIRRRLAASSSDAYEPDVAMTCSNLAILYHDLGRDDEAEMLHKEALDIYRRLAVSSPDAYEPDVARTCSNLAALYSDFDRCDEAEKLFIEALDTYRRLAASSPDAYEPDVAEICKKLAFLYKYLNRYDESEKMYIEALDTYRRLAASSSDAYEPDVAMTCNGLALLYLDSDRYVEAEEQMTLSLDLYYKLYKSQPSDYAELANNTYVVLKLLCKQNYRFRARRKVLAALRQKYPDIAD